MRARTVVVRLRAKNHLTWPVANEMGLKDGDSLIVTYDDETQEARVRPLRTSYAVALAGVYGKTAKEVRAYLLGERESWG